MHPRSCRARQSSTPVLGRTLFALGLFLAAGCATIRPHASSTEAQQADPSSQTDALAGEGRTSTLPTAIWIKGHYAYLDGRYVWVPGHWQY